MTDPEHSGRHRLRIAFYVKGFPVTETGGPVEVAFNLVREVLKGDDADVTLIVQTDTEEREIRTAFQNPGRLRIVRLAYFPSMDDIRILPQVLSAIRNADLIHFNEFPLRHVGYVVLARILGIPTVFSMHGPLSSEASAFLGPQYPVRFQVAGRHTEVRAPRLLIALITRLHRWIAPRWTAVVLNSAASFRRTVESENVNPSRARVIPNGINLSGPLPAPPSTHGGPVRLLFIGKLEDVKGPDLLLSALDTLGRTGCTVDLSIVGGGSLETALRGRAEGLRGHRITFHGYVPHDGIWRFLEWSDIVVVPSRYEGFPIVVLEAMAAGRPLVATRVGGIPEVLAPTRNAILVTPDPESIAAGIRQLIDRPDLRDEMGRANRKDVLPYSWSEIVPRYLSLYEDLLSESGRARSSPDRPAGG